MVGEEIAQRHVVALNPRCLDSHPEAQERRQQSRGIQVHDFGVPEPLIVVRWHRPTCLGQLLVELPHETQEVIQAGLVEEEQRLVARNLLDARHPKSAEKGEQSAVPHPKHVACASLLQEGSKVLILGAETIVRADGAAQPPPGRLGT